VVAASREDAGRQLATWLHAILAGASGSAARFVDAPASLSISPRREAQLIDDVRTILGAAGRGGFG